MALTIWSQSFAHPQYVFASDLDDIGDLIRGHDRLMQHWQQDLRVLTYDLDYEAMVANPESTLEALHTFVSLPAATAPVTARSSTTAITTTSVWQARQSIYSTSVGRWGNYLSFVPEPAQF